MGRTRRKETRPAGTYEVAIHEAGHTVADLALGKEVSCVWIRGEEGMTETPGFALGRLAYQLWDAESLRGLPAFMQRTLLAQWRGALITDLAGPLAEVLDMELKEYSDDGEFLSEEMVAEFVELERALGGTGHNWRRLASDRFQSEGLPNTEDLIFGEDAEALLRHVRAICRMTGGDLLSEVRQAERRCCRLLMARWRLVERLAGSLVRRASGRMTLGQIVLLLGEDVILSDLALMEEVGLIERLPPAGAAPVQPGARVTVRGRRKE